MSCFDKIQRAGEIIDVKPLPGSDVRKCIYEALEVVRIIGGAIRMRNNGAELIVDSSKTYQELYEAWDKARED